MAATEERRRANRNRRHGRNRGAPSGPPRSADRPRLVYGEGETLRFGKWPIRVLPVNGVLHFALPDVIDALGFVKAAATVLDDPDFPSNGNLVCGEAADPEVPGKPQDVITLTPVGLLAFTCLTGAYHGQGLARWARQEARNRCPNPAPRDRARLFLTVQPNGKLPFYPARFSGWRAEWIALREKNPGSDWAGRYREAA